MNDRPELARRDEVKQFSHTVGPLMQDLVMVMVYVVLT